jgi:hypothetical protein
MSGTQSFLTVLLFGQALPVGYTVGPGSIQPPIQMTEQSLVAQLQAQQAHLAQLQSQVAAGVMPLGQASHEGGNPSHTSPATPEASLGHEAGMNEGQIGSGGSSEADADGVPFKKRPRI